MNRRQFIRNGAGCIGLGYAESAFGIGVPHRTMSHIERVDAALQGKPVDRPPYTLYLRSQQATPRVQAHDHLRFQREFNTDIVKVMNPYPYPAPESPHWFDIKTVDSPYPDQLTTLQVIGKGLKNRVYFVDSICSPFTTAWYVFNKERHPDGDTSVEEFDTGALQAFREFQNSNGDAWTSALEAITQSTINHIAKAKEIGVSGVFVNVINASSRFGAPEDYDDFSRLYDERVLRELSDTKLAVVHLQDFDNAFLPRLAQFGAPVVHYSTIRTGISIGEIRKHFSGTIMGGVDEISFDRRSARQIRKEWTSAWAEAGPRFIVAPGGPVPSESTGRQLGHLQDSLAAW
jgi:uroporphyrinogen-III decarboxylase